jgi:uncharacterized membrane-anchored protein
MNNATQAQTAGASTLLVSGLMFGLSVLVTLAFGYALIADQSRISDVWVWVRGLPLAIQIVLWLLLLPWMVALWAWTLPLTLWVRVLMIVVILGAAEFLLFPWKSLW